MIKSEKNQISFVIAKRVKIVTWKLIQIMLDNRTDNFLTLCHLVMIF